MLALLPVAMLITTIAVVYAGLILAAAALFLTMSPTLRPWETVAYAGTGATILQLLLFFGRNNGWKWLWRAFPVLNDVLFPAIEGDWNMRIEWKKGDDNGVVSATATFKQTLLKISMEVFSEGSESETLVATPKRHQESGRPMLYYVYRVVPKNNQNDAGHPYEGSAVLKFAGPNELAGNYFTSQSTTGRFLLTRLPARLLQNT